MLFNSFDFAVFLPVVFCVYWFFLNKNIQIQNGFVVFASYIFYGWWDWRFLTLIIFSTVIDYFVGRGFLYFSSISKRRFLLYLSVIVNLGLLGFFKYHNFFLENFIEAFRVFGLHFKNSGLSIVLPVGISFYTFQTLSYTIDCYKKKITPTKNFLAFSAFVCFFPQLVAGPIERAKNLLPQFYKKRIFNYSQSVNGLRQILWGFFKKIVIADNCAVFVNVIFNNPSEMSGSTLLCGALLFSFQIYGDFSGYSDIAIGVSRLFGFSLKQNFAFPYFSRDIAEFWRRWHISLSGWFKDYLYVPLGGSRVCKIKKIRNTFVIFLVSGFWHGANWTFIVWGAINAIFFLPLLLVNINRKNLDVVAKNKILPNIKDFFSVLSTFLLISLAWIFFRAKSLSDAFTYISGVFSKSLFSLPDLNGDISVLSILFILFFFLLIEWFGRSNQYGIEKTFIRHGRVSRWLFYYALLICLFIFSGKEQEFIYFQF